MMVELFDKGQRQRSILMSDSVYDPSARTQSQMAERERQKICNGPLVQRHLNLRTLIISNNFIGRQVGARPTMCSSTDGEAMHPCFSNLHRFFFILTEILRSCSLHSW